MLAEFNYFNSLNKFGTSGNAKPRFQRDLPFPDFNNVTQLLIDEA
jgi:hypothetical protein